MFGLDTLFPIADILLGGSLLGSGLAPAAPAAPAAPDGSRTSTMIIGGEGQRKEPLSSGSGADSDFGGEIPKDYTVLMIGGLVALVAVTFLVVKK